MIIGDYKQHAAKDLVKAGASPTEIAVSCDGTWQRRYGHNSLLDATFIISIDNGCFIDYILSKAKHLLRVIKLLILQISGIETMNFFCETNHKGSSGSMEKEGAVEMYLCSIDKNITSSMQNILVTVIHDSSYFAGAFSSHLTSDTFVPTVKKKKFSQTEISFIHDDSVKLVVTNNLI